MLNIFDSSESLETLNETFMVVLANRFSIMECDLFCKNSDQQDFSRKINKLCLGSKSFDLNANLYQIKSTKYGDLLINEVKCKYFHIKTSANSEMILCYCYEENLAFACLEYCMNLWASCREKLLQKINIESMTRKLSDMRNVSRELGRNRVLKTILSDILEKTIAIVEAEKGFIMLYNENTESLYIEVAQGMDDLNNSLNQNNKKVLSGENIQNQVFKTLQPVIVNEKSALLALGLEKDIYSIICVPLICNNEAIGVIYVSNKQTNSKFSLVDLDLLSILAGNVSSVVDQGRLYKKSVTDFLTSLYSRSYFESKMIAELKRSTRFDHSLSVLMLDIDCFKKVNDTYGHSVGDDVIKMVAEHITSNVRVGVDLAARYGGDEFSIMLPETPLDGAIVVGDRILESIEASIMETKGFKLKLTVSIGVASNQENNVTDYKELLNFADEALYNSKKNGRNKISAYES